MKKTKKIIVRITETQFKRLADALFTEQKNKSTIVRAALDHYMDGNKSRIEKQLQNNNENQKTFK